MEDGNLLVHNVRERESVGLVENMQNMFKRPKRYFSVTEIGFQNSLLASV